MSRPESVSSRMAVFRFEHHELEDLVALLLAAGEPFVDGAGGEFAVDLQQVHFGVEILVIGDGVDVLALGQAGLERGADEVGIGDTGDFGRVLEGQEDAGARPLVDGHAEDFLAIEGDGAAGDDIAFMAGDDFREGGFAGTVRAHDGVDFTGSGPRG